MDTIAYFSPLIDSLIDGRYVQVTKPGPINKRFHIPNRGSTNTSQFKQASMWSFNTQGHV